MQTLAISAKVADSFQEAYAHEVLAAAQYNQFAALQSAKGYAKLATKHTEEAAEEMGHARKLAEWLTVCGQSVSASAATLDPTRIVPEQLRAALRIEEKAISVYEDIMEQADGESDYNSYQIAAAILADSRGHYIWLMQQLSLIEEIGLPDWLAMWS